MCISPALAATLIVALLDGTMSKFAELLLLLRCEFECCLESAGCYFPFEFNY